MTSHHRLPVFRFRMEIVNSPLGLAAKRWVGACVIGIALILTLLWSGLLDRRWAIDLRWKEAYMATERTRHGSLEAVRRACGLRH